MKHSQLFHSWLAETVQSESVSPEAWGAIQSRLASFFILRYHDFIGAPTSEPGEATNHIYDFGWFYSCSYWS